MVADHLGQGVQKPGTIVQGRGAAIVCDPGFVGYFPILAIQLR
jgi:hypothetical protein